MHDTVRYSKVTIKKLKGEKEMTFLQSKNMNSFLLQRLYQQKK